MIELLLLLESQYCREDGELVSYVGGLASSLAARCYGPAGGSIAPLTRNRASRRSVGAPPTAPPPHALLVPPRGSNFITLHML